MYIKIITKSISKTQKTLRLHEMFLKISYLTIVNLESRHFYALNIRYRSEFGSEYLNNIHNKPHNRLLYLYLIYYKFNYMWIYFDNKNNEAKYC